MVLIAVASLPLPTGERLVLVIGTLRRLRIDASSAAGRQCREHDPKKKIFHGNLSSVFVGGSVSNLAAVLHSFSSPDGLPDKAKRALGGAACAVLRGKLRDIGDTEPWATALKPASGRDHICVSGPRCAVS